MEDNSRNLKFESAMILFCRVEKGESETKLTVPRLALLFFLLSITLTSALVPLGKADPAAILRVSLPGGTLVGLDPDPWLSEGWLLQFYAPSGTFTVRINNTSEAKRSYDTHIIIALNDVGYNNIQSLIVNGITIPKSAFKYGTPKPYNLWTWPGDVYPTWFNDTLVNIGTIERKGFKDVTVSATFLSVDGIRMHFDAWGKKVAGSPTVGDITHSPNSEDSTVLFWSGPPPPPQPPFADFSYTPLYPNVGDVVTFDASGSYDPDGGSIVSYRWDFGDGSPVVVEADPVTTHAFSAFGSFTVNLTVTDNESQTAVKTLVISVSQHPVASFFFSPTDPLEHEVVTFDASTSSPDGGTLVSYEWDFGDGSPRVVEADPISTHAYNTFGTYSVTLNVTDSEGKWDTETKFVTVEGLPMADFFWTPADPLVGQTVNFDGSLSTPDGGVLVSWEWNFGDGTPLVKENDPLTIHIFASAGTFTVTLNVTDSEGRWDMSSKVITITPVHTITIPAVTGGTTDPTSGTYSYPEGYVLPVTAFPDPNYVFDHWDLDGVNVGSSNPYSLTVDADHILTPVFVLIQYGITFGQSGIGTDYPGTVLVVDGVNYPKADMPRTFSWDTGSVHTFEFLSPLLVTANSKQYVWTSTTGLSSQRSGSITVSSAGSITGNYKTQYYLTVSSPRGTTGGQGWYDSGTTAYATVTPLTVAGAPGVQYVFTNWSGDATGTTSPSNPITMNSPKAATANWKTQYYFTITSGYGSPNPMSGYVDSGTVVTASVTSPSSGPPGTRYVCIGWIGTGDVPASGTSSSVSFTLTQPSSITWNWKTQYLLNVGTDPTGLSPQPTRNPPGEQGSSWWYDAATMVTLTAQPITGYTFSYWDVGGASQGSGVNPITISIGMPLAATAHYSQIIQYTLTITSTTGGTTNPVPASYTYDAGTLVSVLAAPNVGYVLDHWELDSVPAGNSNPINVLMNTAHTLRAVFVAAPPTTYTLTISPSTGGATNPAPGTYPYSPGTSVPVTAIPSPGYVFDHWELDGVNVGSTIPYNLLMDRDHTLRAVFILQQPPAVGGVEIAIPKPNLTVGPPLGVMSVLIALVAVGAALTSVKYVKRHK